MPVEIRQRLERCSRFEPESELFYAVLSNTTRGAWPLVRQLDALLPELGAARDGAA